MAGIYIHVPFCKTRCIYCGFYSTTSLDRRDEYVDCVCQELLDRKDYLADEDVETIYFGGGTPSQLSLEQIDRILSSIYNIYKVRARTEITLEGNPDDLTPDFLSGIRSLGVNRLSMGIQSFDDEKLRFLHRRHSAQQAVEAVSNALNAGFENISVDLMFGFPGQTLEEWGRDVEQALHLPGKHISAYSLMYDEGTLLEKMLENGQVEEVDEELSLQMYRHLVNSMCSGGYEHYEISNFCKPGYASRHNSGYWHGAPYLGVGAGAHSFDGRSRQYNVDSIDAYMKGAEQVREELTKEERYNEFVFTGLRTKEGISLGRLRTEFGDDMYRYCMNCAEKHVATSKLERVDVNEKSILRLTAEGVFVSNDIMSDLMWVE